MLQTNENIRGESMLYLNLDENNYLLSVASIGGGIPADIDLAEYDLTGSRIRAHKWENDTLIFDADRYAEIEQEQNKITHEEINKMIVAKIRERYDANEEFKMINIGITDSDNEQYQAYRAYVAECIAWGDTLERGAGSDVLP